MTNVNSEFFSQIEWNIKAKTAHQECSNFILLIQKLIENNLLNIEKLEKISKQFNAECNSKDLKQRIDEFENLNLKKGSKEAKELEKVKKILNFDSLAIENNKYLVYKINLNETIEGLNKLINLIENTNPMMNYFEELKRIGTEKDKTAKQKKRRNEIIRSMRDLLDDNSLSEFDERLKNKFDFLVKNSEKILLHQENYNEECLDKSFFEMHILPEEKRIKIHLRNSGHLYVGYCLVKRIENTFTNDGEVKFSEFLSNGVGQEYGLELKEALGQIRLDMK